MLGLKEYDVNIMANLSIPNNVKGVMGTLEDAGFEAYIVGGCVRDILLSKEPKDWDITTNAKPEQIRKNFPDSFYENKFGTVTVKSGSKKPNLSEIELTTYRIEGKYSDMRHPDTVKFAKTLEEDLGRRDFTINSMAIGFKPQINTKYQVLNTKYVLIDLFGGRDDLKNKLIRAVGEPSDRFEEDALRMMRAVRLATELGFSIEDKTFSAIKNNAELMKHIAQERIRDELFKIIATRNAYNGIYLLKGTGLLRIILPELAEGIGVTQNKHHIYTVFEHNALSLKWAAEHDYPFHVRLAALFHDIGKVHTKRGEGAESTFYGHEIVGSRLAKNALTRLKGSVLLENKVSLLVKYHMFYYNVGEVTERSVRRLVAKVGPHNMDDLVKLRICDRMGSGVPKPEPYRQRHFQYMVEKVQRDPISPKMLKMNGNSVMELLRIEPGPKVGQLLAILLDDVLDDPRLNTKKYLTARIKELGDLSEEALSEVSETAKEKNMQFDKAGDESIKEKYWVK